MRALTSPCDTGLVDSALKRWNRNYLSEHLDPDHKFIVKVLDKSARGWFLYTVPGADNLGGFDFHNKVSKTSMSFQDYASAVDRNQQTDM